MKLHKIAAAVVMMLAVCSFAQINLLSPSINFRDANSAGNYSFHYGDLQLLGGNAGSSWGWLWCNQVHCTGMAFIGGKVFAGAGLEVTGNFDVISGTKNFIQMHPTDSTKAIKFIAIEAGEALTLARGTATTYKGVSEITLPEPFSLVTSDSAPLTVLLTPEKVPVLLFTQDKSKNKIVVSMKKSDYIEFGDAQFAWQVTGVRDGYENEQIIVDIDKNGDLKENAVVSTKRAKMNERTAQWIEKRKAAGLRKN